MLLEQTSIANSLESRFPGAKPEVIFSLNENLNKGGDRGEFVSVPKEHKFVMTGISNQQLSVLAQYPNAGNTVGNVQKFRRNPDQQFNDIT